MSVVWRVITALLAFVALSGCPSAHSGLSARPLGKGAAEVGLHSGLLIGEEGEVYPTGNMEVRVGVSPSTDVLLETGMVGIGLGFKSTLTPQDSPVAIAVAPAVSGLPLLISNGVRLGLPVLIGVPYRAHELTVSPRLDLWHYDALVGLLAGNAVTAGGTLAVSVKLGPIRLVPELGVIHVLSSSGTIFGQAAEGELRATVAQTNLFLLFERRSRAARDAGG